VLILLAWLLLLPPVPASRVAAHALGRPDLADDIVAVTRRESRGVRVGVHECDAWASRRVREAAIRTGWLDERCRNAPPHGWSTRGAHGLMAGFNLRYLGTTACVPWVLDIPIVSAVAAVRKAAAVCPDNPWCHRGAS
jgi:hypothetical protein